VALSGEYAVTANAGDQTLSVIPIGQPAVATTLPLGQSPSDLAAGPNAPVAFAVPMGGSSLLVANLDAPAPVTTLGAGGPIDQVLAPLDNSSGPLLLVSDTDDTIRSLDPNSGALGAPLQLSAGPHTAAVGTDAQGNPQVYVTNAGDGSVEIVDPAATAIQANVEVGGRPVGAVSALNGQLWVADGDAGTVTGINLSSHQAVDTIQVGPGLTGLSATPDGRYLLASSSDPTHALYSIDLFGVQAGETDGVLRSIEVDSGVSALAAGAEVTVAYATTGANQLLYWDIAGNTITHTVPVGQKPVALALSQAAPTGLSPALARVGGGTISTSGSSGSGATGGSGSGGASSSASTGSSGTGSSTSGAASSTSTGSTGTGANGTSGSTGAGGGSSANSGGTSAAAAATGAAGSTTGGSGATTGGTGTGAVSSGASTTSGAGTTGASSAAQPAAAGAGSASSSTSSSSIASGGTGGGGSAGGAASIQCSGCSSGGGGASGSGAPAGGGASTTISSGGSTSGGGGTNPSGASGSSSISSGGSTISTGGSNGSSSSGISGGGSSGSGGVSTGISSGGGSGISTGSGGSGSSGVGTSGVGGATGGAGSGGVGSSSGASSGGSGSSSTSGGGSAGHASGGGGSSNNSGSSNSSNSRGSSSSGH
jgi:YVTN family beta-propeller protein